MLRAIRNRWRRSFVTSIAIVALLGVVVFALVVYRVVHEQIRDQAHARAADSAQVLARTAFAPRLPAPGTRLARADLRALDRQLRAARGREGRLQVRVWARDGTVLYAAQRRRIGRRATRPPAVVRALRGRTASAVAGPDEDEVLQTAVPIVRATGARPAGALELRTPYAPVAADVSRRSRRLAIALAVVALLAYLLALPGLLRAGRALRAQYDPRRVEVVRDLRRALDHGEIAVHFQPIVEAATRRPASAEALVRWQDPRKGAIAPDRFIPLVEGTEAMWPLTARVLDLAIRECARWRAEGHEVQVAVNVSAAVLDDRRLAKEVEGLLATHQLAPDALEIEVTEGAVMRDADAAAHVLRGLTALGVGVIAIDDFGTGYSSLARLHELPLDSLKIDQSFVMRMAREGDASIVCSIVELAHALGLKVIAEGAEDDATIDRLAELGADFVQGYGVTRPLAPDDFHAWLAAAPSGDWRAWSAGRSTT